MNTQNDLLLHNLMNFYKKKENLILMMSIVNGESQISLRIIDWFSTNYSKKYYTIYNIDDNTEIKRFKVYNDYKCKLKAFRKEKFDPFCRWERITIPFGDEKYIETTIGQLNFFKWAIEFKVIDYIKNYIDVIEMDMNNRNSSSKKIKDVNENTKTRKKREELSVSATKCIKKENMKITVKFN
jgi:hypothetical protein